MQDLDHKLSPDIIETAAAHNVKVIKLKQLQNIRKHYSLHTWYFYKLAQ